MSNVEYPEHAKELARRVRGKGRTTMWLYPMHERLKEKQAIRDGILTFVGFLLSKGRHNLGEMSVEKISDLIDEHHGINHAELELEKKKMEEKQKELEERRARGEKPGSSVLDKRR